MSTLEQRRLVHISRGLALVIKKVESPWNFRKEYKMSNCKECVLGRHFSVNMFSWDFLTTSLFGVELQTRRHDMGTHIKDTKFGHIVYNLNLLFVDRTFGSDDTISKVVWLERAKALKLIIDIELAKNAMDDEFMFDSVSKLQ